MQGNKWYRVENCLKGQYDMCKLLDKHWEQRSAWRCKMAQQRCLAMAVEAQREQQRSHADTEEYCTLMGRDSLHPLL